MDRVVSPDFVQRTLSGAADLLALHAAHPERYPFLLQSTAAGGPQGRCDILFAFPGEALILHADGHLSGAYANQEGGDFLHALDGWWRREQASGSAPQAPPFRGGWFLFLGYELAAQIEPVLRLPVPELPRAWAVRVPAAVIRDHGTGTTQLVAEIGAEPLLETLQADLAAAPPALQLPSRVLAEPLREEEPGRYLRSVTHAREYIHAGDIFQANLARRWQASLRPSVSAAQVYGHLSAANPAPFAGLACRPDHAVISSSPERLIRVRDRRVEVRPIAGTRPRSGDSERDAALVQELIAHPKERAEHVMLLDLERNDLGRICRNHSVHVDELMIVESYAHVHHIVSNVCGELRPGVTPGEVMRAVFPGGTITGCPKVRCMQIIAELEQAARGAYTGAMGYLNRDGDLDLNILIRTLVQQDRRLEFRAGAGIVADSIPERELEETRAKARGLARALGADT